MEARRGWDGVCFGVSFAQHLEEQRCLDPREQPRYQCWQRDPQSSFSAWNTAPGDMHMTEAEDEDGGPPACCAGALFCPSGQG